MQYPGTPRQPAGSSHRLVLSRTLLLAAAWPLAAVSLLIAAVGGGCKLPEQLSNACPAADAAAVSPAAGTPEVTTIASEGKRYTVCHVDLSRQRLELFWRDDSGTPFRGFGALSQWLHARGRTLTFAMNAGMYREDFSPVGLYVEHGKTLRPLNLSRGRGNFCLRPNGVFAITRSGARVVESSQYPAIQKQTVFATQSGPMLVIDGLLHPAFRANSQSRLIRNGVGVVSSQRVVFAISENAVNFYEFARFFRDVLQCRNALYLDGSVSSLYSESLHRNDSLTYVGPIVAVTRSH